MTAHPMGEVVPNAHFVWVKVVRETEYHAIVVQGTEEEARAAAIEVAENYELSAQTSKVLSIEPRVRPVRTGHKVQLGRDDIAYIRDIRARREI